MESTTQGTRNIAGFVLAGGRSSRMGQDKALLRLAGEPLIHHAVRKARRVTTEVAILSSRAELADFAPLVPDLGESCGPLTGMHAGLLSTRAPWSLIMP